MCDQVVHYQHLMLEHGNVKPIPVEHVEVAPWLHAKDSWLLSPVQPLTSGMQLLQLLHAQTGAYQASQIWLVAILKWQVGW